MKIIAIKHALQLPLVLLILVSTKTYWTNTQTFQDHIQDTASRTRLKVLSINK